MADKRAYFKLDVGYLSNPKVLAVLDESPTAILLHVASIGYAAQHLTDGVVPVKAILRMTGASQRDAVLLHDAGLWIDGPDAGQAEVHDYLQHQRSAAEVKGASEKAKRAASVRWDASSNAPSMPDAEPDASEFAMPRKRERKKETTSSAIADAIPEAARVDVERLCSQLASAVQANGVKRPTITKGWHDAARLLLDKDGHTEAQVAWIIQWVAADEFWRSNILSMPKLREKYDQLVLKARGSNVRHLPQQPDDQGRTILPPLPGKTPWGN